MAFIYTGETATVQQMTDRVPPGSVVMSMAWSPSPSIMFAKLVEMIRTIDVTNGQTLVIITDPMGVVMRDVTGNRINLNGPKDVFWFSSEPDYMVCRHPSNGQLGLLHAPVRTTSAGVVSVNTGIVTALD